VTSYAARIPVKSRREIEQMREAACHVAEILLELRERALPGVTTGELDEYAEASISRRGVRSSFKGYDPDGLPRYPAVLCVSVNDEIVHGIPGSRELVDWGTSGRRKGACSTCRAGRSTKPWR
jgi:methionyl aminopeptidase